MTKTARVKCALGYIRTSTRPQATDGVGIDDQEIGLRRYYDRVGIELVQIYRDVRASGTSNNRPGLQALIEHAVRPGSVIAEIGVFSLSRVFRDRDLLDQFRHELKRAGISLVSLMEEVESR